MMETLLDISGNLSGTDIATMGWPEGYLYRQFWGKPYKIRARCRCFCELSKLSVQEFILALNENSTKVESFLGVSSFQQWRSMIS